jgi:hypothetical protein
MNLNLTKSNVSQLPGHNLIKFLGAYLGAELQ